MAIKTSNITLKNETKERRRIQVISVRLHKSRFCLLYVIRFSMQVVRIYYVLEIMYATPSNQLKILEQIEEAKV